MNCPVCGQELALGAAFCQHCGAKLNGYCPICGKPLVKNARFCQYCGAQCGTAGPLPMQRPEEAAPAPCTASAAACAPEGAGASDPPSSAEPARPQEPSPAPAPVLEAPAPGLQSGLEKQPAYYKAEFEKLSQGKKTDFNFAACFLGFWHTLYRGCWRRFLLLYSWLGVLTAASGLVAAHELETVVMMNTAYASAAWHWDGTVSAFISAVLMLQVAVALYNGTTFNEYYYKVCRREASDAEKRQIGLVAGVLVSVAAAVGVLAFAVYSYGNGKVQGTLYRQKLLEDAAVRGPQVQQALTESEVYILDEQLFLRGYVPEKDMPASLADRGVGEQVLKSIRLFYDDEHSLGQVMNAAGLQPFFSELTVQEDGSALGFIFCKIGESFLELDLKIQPGQRTVVFTNALFLDSEMEKSVQASTNQAASLLQWMYGQAGMDDTPGLARRIQGTWEDEEGNRIYITSYSIDGQDIAYQYVLDGDIPGLVVSGSTIFGVASLTEDDVLVWGYGLHDSVDIETMFYKRVQ